MKYLLPVLLLVAACDGLDVSPNETPAPAPPGGGNGGTISFSIDILPLFQSDCITCHGGAGGLNLESFAGIQQGGASGPVSLHPVSQAPAPARA